jgi:uncharacterized membrane protein YkgB
MSGKPFPASCNGISEDHHSSSVDTDGDHEGLVVSEVQLLLAEKRTSLAALRTGIAVFVLPISVLSILVATSGYYDVDHVLYFIVPLLSLSGALVILAFYLIIRSMLRMHHQDRLIMEIKKTHPMIAPFID